MNKQWDYSCESCGKRKIGWDADFNVCCGEEMTRGFGGARTYESRGALYDTTLPDECWGKSRSETRSIMREKGLYESGDRVGGARNEDHLNTGKLFSYKGAPTKRSDLF